MKKRLLLFGIMIFFCSVSWANNFKNNQEMLISSCPKCQEECSKKDNKAPCTQENFDEKNKKDFDVCFKALQSLISEGMAEAQQDAARLNNPFAGWGPQTQKESQTQK